VGNDRRNFKPLEGVDRADVEAIHGGYRSNHSNRSDAADRGRLVVGEPVDGGAAAPALKVQTMARMARLDPDTRMGILHSQQAPAPGEECADGLR
jgi:hypothetical protein